MEKELLKKWFGAAAGNKNDCNNHKDLCPEKKIIKGQWLTLWVKGVARLQVIFATAREKCPSFQFTNVSLFVFSSFNHLLSALSERPLNGCLDSAVTRDMKVETRKLGSCVCGGKIIRKMFVLSNFIFAEETGGVYYFSVCSKTR